MQGRKIIVGVTGGVAAYKSATLVSRLVQRGADVRVVMSEPAKQFVGTATFAALSGQAVMDDLFATSEPLGAHITLARDAELFCVAPATANFLAHTAGGVAGSLLTALYLCFTGPVLMAPAMNCEMWEKPAVQRNVSQLQKDGVQMIGPETGWLSCRQQGAGRMTEPDDIVSAIADALS